MTGNQDSATKRISDFYIREFQLTCKGAGFEQFNKFEFLVTREYSIPTYIGCMVRVTYYAIYGNETNFLLRAFMRNVADEKPSSYETVRNISIYREDVQHEASLPELKDLLEDSINDMFALVESQLKNVLGMERIA